MQLSFADPEAREVFELLSEKRQTLVLAESCTAGLIAAVLGRVPGMSAWLAGSLVVYQVASKVGWLGIPQQVIDEHNVVSSDVAAAMARQALEATSHATVSLAITGHLGPSAPEELDGVAWIGMLHRSGRQSAVSLHMPGSPASDPVVLRHERQAHAVQHTLRLFAEFLKQQRDG